MSDDPPSSFFVKDCALAAIATGIRAQSLIELRDKLSIVPISCIYYHFWGGRLRTSFEYREYHNDFSFWVHHVLHDEVLAERLEILDPTEYNTMEELRDDIIGIIDTRLEEVDTIAWIKGQNQFHFISSKIVVFETPHQVQEPHELVQVLPRMTSSSFFYHFIDSGRRITNRKDDISSWLESYQDKYLPLVNEIRKVDPYLISLSDLKNKLIQMVTEYFLTSK